MKSPYSAFTDRKANASPSTPSSANEGSTASAAQPEHSNSEAPKEPQKRDPLLIDHVESWLNKPLYPIALYFTIFSAAFWNNLDVPTGDRTADNIGMSSQVFVKLGFILLGFALGAWGWWVNPRVRALTTSIPGYALFFLGFWQIASALLSRTVSLTLGIAGAVSYWGALLVIMSGIVYLGARRVVTCLTAGLITFCIGSILFLFISPENAFFSEVMDLTNKVIRFGGLGHPNTLGRMAILVAVLFVAIGLDRRLPWKWCVPLSLFFFFEAAATLSRTPLIAGFASLAAITIPKISREKAIYAIGYCAGLAILLLLAMELTIGTNSITAKIIAKGTKTGDLDEVTTLTGRTEIWAFALELAMERPIFGHGPGATPILMEKKSGHAHNALLDPTANLGFPAGAAIIIVFSWLIYCCIRDDNSVYRAGVVFLVVAGISERLLFGTIPDSISYYWLAFAFWGVIPDKTAPRGTTNHIV